MLPEILNSPHCSHFLKSMGSSLRFSLSVEGWFVGWRYFLLSLFTTVGGSASCSHLCSFDFAVEGLHPISAELLDS